jgi:hypothetical protein
MNYPKGCMIIVRGILYFIFLYTALCIFLYLMQRRILYHSHGTVPADTEIQALGLRFWPPGSAAYRGLISTDQKVGSAGTVVVFHGNGGSAVNRFHYMQFLEPLGYRVVLAEYPGYGGRSGRLNEKIFLEDARITVRLVHELYGLPVFLCGESLGCGVAAGAAVHSDFPIQGVVLITPWDSLTELARTRYRIFPVRLLMRDRYDNIHNLKDFPGRVAVALAEFDEVIPNKHGMRLYGALSCEKRLWVWKGTGHNSWPGIVDTDWWKEAMEFLAQY